MAEKVPIAEDFPLKTMNPYELTNLMFEKLLKDLYATDPEWSISFLRYFNPIRAHESGLIGDNPNGIPNHKGSQDNKPEVNPRKGNEDFLIQKDKRWETI